MKTVFKIKHRKTMIFVTTLSFLAGLLTGCANQTLSDSLPQDQAIITDDNTNNNMDDIPAESEELYEENSESAEDEITEQQLYTYIIEDNSAVITGLQEEYEVFLQQNMSDGKIKIPDMLGGYPVVEIGTHVFEDINLKRVYLPDSVEVIKDSAFRNTGIEYINISECYNLKKVGNSAFENCNLQDNSSDYYPLSWSMEEIGERAFAGNEQLTKVNFPRGDVIISEDAFEGCGDELNFFVEQSREETGNEVEAYAAANGIKVEYAVATQINAPSEPLLLTPEIGSFFYGELGGTYDDLGDEMYANFEKASDAPNFGFEDWQWPGCSKWCHINIFDNHVTASSELSSASDRYCADNVVTENREFAWAEGAEGVGIGEYIVYDQTVFSGTLIEWSGNYIRKSYYKFSGQDGCIDYTQICIVNGYARDEQVWQENGRVKTFMMYVDDQSYARLELEDTMNPQYFTIPQGDIRVANGEEVTFKFVIEAVYPGTVYEDTCITGIVVDFGNVPYWH